MLNTAKCSIIQSIYSIFYLSFLQWQFFFFSFHTNAEQLFKYMIHTVFDVYIVENITGLFTPVFFFIIIICL